MEDVLKNKTFTAMFIMSDWAAYIALYVSREKGIKVPEELSIIGFDNLPFTEFTQPPLTTIYQNSKDTGQKAVDLLLGLMDGKPPLHVL